MSESESLRILDAMQLVNRQAERIDELERELANVTYGDAAGRREKAIEQATIERCAKSIDPAQYPNVCDRGIVWKCYGAIRALVRHAGKEPEAGASGPELVTAARRYAEERQAQEGTCNADHGDTGGSAPGSDPTIRVPWKNPARADFAPRTAQLLAANVCNVQVWADALSQTELECAHLLAVADAAKTYCCLVSLDNLDALFDAVRPMERGDP